MASCPDGGVAEYSERLLVGSVGLINHHEVEPAFCFGHGLTFSEFTYIGLTVVRRSTGTGAEDVSLSIRFTVTNTGSNSAADIPQVYLAGLPSGCWRATAAAQGIKKTAVVEPIRTRQDGSTITTGHDEVVTLELTPRDLSIWDVTEHRFKVFRGEFTAFVGASSCDIRLTGAATV